MIGCISHTYITSEGAALYKFQPYMIEYYVEYVFCIILFEYNYQGAAVPIETVLNQYCVGYMLNEYVHNITIQTDSGYHDCYYSYPG